MFVNEYIDRKALSRRQQRRVVRLSAGTLVMGLVLLLAVMVGGLAGQPPVSPAAAPGPLVTFSVAPIQ